MGEEETHTKTTCLADRMNRPSISRRFQEKITVILVLRCVLGGIFAYSGVVKLMDPERFTVIIAGFGLLPEALIRPAAILLPLLELLSGIGLIFAVRGCLSAIALMLVMFMAVLAWGIHLGLDIDCGCFGPEDPEQAYKGLKTALVRDGAMMLAVLAVYWQNWKAQRARQSLINRATKE